VPDLHRGFESFPLRQQVLTAEKFRRPFPRDTRNRPVFHDIHSETWTAENGLVFNAAGVDVPFLCGANTQSGFGERIRRMQGDHMYGIRP
jgi:hypothetical protein